MLKDGKLNFYWVQVNNNVQAAHTTQHETYQGYRNPETSSSSPTSIDDHRYERGPDLPLPCGWRKKAPTAMRSAEPMSGTNW